MADPVFEGHCPRCNECFTSDISITDMMNTKREHMIQRHYEGEIETDT